MHSQNIPGHLFRGYTIAGQEEKKGRSIREIKQSPPNKGSIWYVFPGLGWQWLGMGKLLLMEMKKIFHFLLRLFTIS